MRCQKKFSLGVCSRGRLCDVIRVKVVGKELIVVDYNSVYTLEDCCIYHQIVIPTCTVMKALIGCTIFI